MNRHHHLLLIAALAAVAAGAGAAAQSATPPADPVLAELRGMRADLNQRLEANIRVQLLLGKLTLQEQRTNDVVRQLAEVSEKLRANAQTKAQIEAGTKMFGGLLDPNNPEAAEGNFLASTLRAQIEAVAKADEELRQRQGDLTAQLTQEQARWQAFNAQLAELERLVEKRK
jgi:hypothetical protein